MCACNEAKEPRGPGDRCAMSSGNGATSQTNEADHLQGTGGHADPSSGGGASVQPTSSSNEASAQTGGANHVERHADHCEPSSGDGAIIPPYRTRVDRRNRKHKSARAQEIKRRAEDRDDGPGFVAEAFGEARWFANSAELFAAWEEYESRTMTLFTHRDSNFVKSWNDRRLKTYVASGNPLFGPAFDSFLANNPPEHLIHSKVVFRRKFGLLAEPRGDGFREVRSSRYIACDARLTVDATRDDNGKWGLKTRAEFHHRNHTCDQAMLESTGKSALLKKPEVLAEVHRMLQARTPTRNIIDSLATNFNIKVTAKQIANLNRDRLGGRSAMDNLKLLLERFAAFPGSNCTLIDDQEGSIVGVVTQSALQHKMFERFGDNLILDWTHNTNNLGFYLGSLMVTSVSGRGVAVFDFLCLEQTESMMKTVFSKFIELNPGATVRVKSVVIDKDYTEWRVLNQLFPTLKSSSANSTW